MNAFTRAGDELGTSGHISASAYAVWLVFM
jgi:hypothetical protein